MSKDFPVMLYLSASQFKIAEDEESEAVLREQGYTDFAKITTPEPEPEPESESESESESELDKQSIMSALDALGIEYDKRLGAKRLAELLPDAD